MKVGPGMDKQSEMGPLVTKEHLAKVKSYVDIGEKEGAELIVDGRNLKLQGYENGYWQKDEKIDIDEPSCDDECIANIRG